MNRDELLTLLELAVDLARRAGDAVREIYQRDDAVVTLKGDRSPLTSADLASHRLIAAELAVARPDLPLLSEEAAEIPWSTRRSWRRSWVVDPLDGTKEFLKRNGEFTINIALVEDGEPVLGVVHAPMLSRSYLAASGLGAFREDASGQRQALDGRRPQEDGMVLVASRSHPSPRLAELLEAFPNHRLFHVGSALKSCLVAEGIADLYPRFGPTMEWDTAAAHAVLRETGGELLGPSGEPLRYNREELRNPSFLAIGRAHRTPDAPLIDLWRRLTAAE